MRSRPRCSTAETSIPCAMAVLLGTMLMQACATTGSFTWVDDVPPNRNDQSEYRLSVRDTISIRVWNQEEMSVPRTQIREDGKISLPFLRDVSVVGLTPIQVSEKLQAALVSFIVDPVVTVALDEAAPLTVSVLGEVTTAGAYTLQPRAGLLHAIAAAGGLNRFADRDAIFVLRRPVSTLPPTRIRFRYRDLTAGGTPAADFRLETGDVVVVE